MKKLIKQKSVIFALFTCFVFFSAYPVHSRSEEEGLNLIRLGEELFKKNDYEDALNKFSDAQSHIRTEKLRLRLHKNLSLVYYALGKEEGAREHVKKILEINIDYKLDDEIAPKYKTLFLGIQSRLKELLSETKTLVDKKSLFEAITKLEQSKEFKDHPEVVKLKNYIKQLYKTKGSGKPNDDEEKLKPLSKPNIAFFADVGLGRTKTSLLTDAGWEYETTLADVQENNFRISLNSLLDDENKQSFMFIPSLGVIKHFMNKIAVMASINFIESTFSFTSGFNFSWKWLSGPDEGETFHVTKFWQDTGKLTLIPINLNLLLTFESGIKNSKFFLYAGPTFFYTKLHLNGHIGVGIIEDGYVVDWFPLEFKIDEKEILFGGNLGAGLEITLNDEFSLYFGAQFFYFPERKYKWEVVPKIYYGELGNFQISDAEEWDIFKNIPCDIGHSILKIHLGLRFYL